MTKIPPQAPSRRTQQLADVEQRLADKADKALDSAAAHAADAAQHAGEAGAALASAGSKALDALDSGLDAAGHALKGTALAVGGAAVRMAEEVGDLMGAAMQQLGRGLITFGNFLRRAKGGPQVTTETLKAKDSGPSLSDRLFAKSKDEFKTAGTHVSAAIDDLVLSGADLKVASGKVLQAAEATLKTARDLGEAGALKVAESAVATARVAVDLAERGVDGAGDALQRAGKAMIEAGNAVNTARGTDTVVSPG